MNESERKIYDKYAYDDTFLYIWRVYAEFERRVNSTSLDYKGLKRGECRFNYNNWEKRLSISHKCMIRAIKDLINIDSVIIQRFKGVKGSDSVYFLSRFEEQNLEQNEEQNEEQKRASNTNELKVVEEQNLEHNKEQKKVYTSKYNNLNIISKEIYMSIFSFWNDKKIRKHKEPKDGKLDKDIEEAIKRTLKDFTAEQIKEAISNYAEMFHSDYKYCEYKWTLIEFLTRSQKETKQRQLKLHMNEGASYEKYLEYKNQEQQITEKPKDEFNAFSTEVRL